jgi:hypothetical protein
LVGLLEACGIQSVKVGPAPETIDTHAGLWARTKLALWPAKAAITGFVLRAAGLPRGVLGAHNVVVVARRSA